MNADMNADMNANQYNRVIIERHYVSAAVYNLLYARFADPKFWAPFTNGCILPDLKSLPVIWLIRFAVPEPSSLIWTTMFAAGAAANGLNERRTFKNTEL